jgi:hypothetical protein
LSTDLLSARVASEEFTPVCAAWAPPRPVMTQLLLLLSTGAPPRDGAL